jgi:hypothetical protein
MVDYLMSELLDRMHTEISRVLQAIEATKYVKVKLDPDGCEN